MANSKRKCKQCGEYEEAATGIKVPAGWFCSTSHAFEFAREKQEKQKLREISKQKQKKSIAEKAERAAHRQKKEALKPASKWLAEAQSAVNRYIRVRDKQEPCISCNQPPEVIEAQQGWKTGGCWDAGHFMTRGAKGQLRFVLFNIHKQCKSCNAGGGKFSHKAATVDQQYRENLIRKIGIEKVEWLESNNELDSRKKDIEYLKRIKRIFAKKARLYERKFRAE